MYGRISKRAKSGDRRIAWFCGSNCSGLSLARVLIVALVSRTAARAPRKDHTFSQGDAAVIEVLLCTGGARRPDPTFSRSWLTRRCTWTLGRFACSPRRTVTSA